MDPSKERNLSLQIANFLADLFAKHKALVDNIQALCLFHKPFYSAIFIIIIEVLFLLATFVKVSIASKICFIVSILLGFFAIYETFPNFFNKFKILEDPSPNAAPLRTPEQLAAYITTCLLFFIKLVENMFFAIKKNKLINVIVNAAGLVIIFAFCYVFGDFIIVWILFHSIVFLPGILLNKNVSEWLRQDEESTQK